MTDFAQKLDDAPELVELCMHCTKEKCPGVCSEFSKAKRAIDQTRRAKKRAAVNVDVDASSAVQCTPEDEEPVPIDLTVAKRDCAEHEPLQTAPARSSTAPRLDPWPWPMRAPARANQRERSVLNLLNIAIEALTRICAQDGGNALPPELSLARTSLIDVRESMFMRLVDWVRIANGGE